MTTTETLLTAEDLLAMPNDGRRTELLDGKVVHMAPASLGQGHWMIRIGSLLESHVRQRNLGFVAGGDPGIFLGRHPDRVRAPDVCFFASGRLPANWESLGYVDVIPDLVVEIVSKNDLAEEVRAKTDEWLRAGVKLVWTVFPRERCIIAETESTIARLREGDALNGAPVLPDFNVGVAELFA